MSKVLLIILDGFGYSEKTEHNAIYKANTPNWDSYWSDHPHSLLDASGEAVGLPSGTMGNSEVGHLNMGSGRIVYQDLSRINKYINETGFENHEELIKLATNPTGTLHIMGLLSDGGVHSHVNHLKALLKSIHIIAKDKPVFIHAITDGRDTPPKSAVQYLKALQGEIDKYPNVNIATICGRFYAMDRDKRWERVKVAYDALTSEADEFNTAEEAIQDAYDKKETDEFVRPRQVMGGVRLAPNDQMVFINYRADRAREISTAFCLEFNEFETPVKINAKNWLTMSKYQEAFPFPTLFPPEKLTGLLGEVVSKQNKAQLRIAETEKYAHVTYFFNGGDEEPYSGEERILVPSPRGVETYDEKPEMSAMEVTEKLVAAINSDKFDLCIVNYANGDMVGHTGNEEAAIKAVNTLDECLGTLIKSARAKDYEILITADHGNCEEMGSDHSPMTQHSMNPVPFLWMGSSRGKSLKDGKLADVAPTILDLMGIEKPQEMTGQSLIK